MAEVNFGVYLYCLSLEIKTKRNLRHKKMAKLNVVDVIAIILLVVGGLNWGLVGLFGFDLVATIFGDMSALSRIVYVVVGVCAVYVAVVTPKLERK